MATLKYLHIDLAASDADSLVPRWGQLPADASAVITWLHLAAPTRSLHAWTCANAGTDAGALPTWTELQRLIDAVHCGAHVLLQANAAADRQRHIKSLAGVIWPRVTLPGVMIYHRDTSRRQLTQLVDGTGEDLQAGIDTWLRSAGQDDVFLTYRWPDGAAFDDHARQLLDQLQREQLPQSRGGAAATPVVSHPPLPEDSAASGAARMAAIKGWLSAEDAGRRLPGGGNAPAQRASRLRRQHRLFAVWLSESRAYRYAPWQFLPSGEPAPVLVDVLALLRGRYGVAAGARTSGWEELEWFIAPHALADGRTPAQLVVPEPALTLQLAQSDFADGAVDARW